MKVKVKKVEKQSDSLINEIDIESASIDKDPSETVNDVPSKKSGVFPFVLFIILGLIALSICFGSENTNKPAPVSSSSQTVELQPPTEYGAKRLAQAAIKDYLESHNTVYSNFEFISGSEKTVFQNDHNIWEYEGLLKATDKASKQVDIPFASKFAIDVTPARDEYITHLYYFSLNDKPLITTDKIPDNSRLYSKSDLSDGRDTIKLQTPTEEIAKGLAHLAVKDYISSNMLDPANWGVLSAGEKIYYHSDDDTWSLNGLLMHGNKDGTFKLPYTATIAIEIDNEINKYVVDLFHLIINNQEKIRKEDRIDKNGLYQRK